MQGLIKKIYEKYKKNNVPFGALFEVTKRCIARCVHCYIDEYQSDELSLHEIDGLFSQLKDIGVFNLGLTGGEPFIRKDFFEILRTAKKYKFYTSILTTGILIDEYNIALLRECGVRSVELSLLGSNKTTHDAVMRYSGAFDRLMRAIPLLLESNIHVTLKTTVLKENYRELPEMRALAKGLEVDVKISISLIQKINKDRTPLEHGLSLDELKQVDISDINDGLVPEENYSEGAILVCNAGRTVIGISPEGDIFPCILFREKLGNIRSRTLKDILVDNPSEFLRELRALRKESFKACLECTVRQYCRRCPGAAYTETGKLGVQSPMDCELAEKIYRVTSEGEL